MKIKLAFCDTHEHLAHFFYSALASRFDIEISKDPEFVIFGDENFGRSHRQLDSKVTKIFYTGENRRPEDYPCDYAITFDHKIDAWHYRLPLFVIYMWALDKIHNTGYEYGTLIKPDRPVKQKDRFASFVVSNPNCKERNEFFDKLSEHFNVDAGGKLFNNQGKVVEGEAGKIDFLSTRKFNICFESGSHPGYITEKILHAYYARTVPIYWGSPSAAADFNPASFINVHDFDTFEHCIDYIKTVDQMDVVYDSYINATPFLFNIPPSYVLTDNLLNWFGAVFRKEIKPRVRKDEDAVIRV